MYLGRAIGNAFVDEVIEQFPTTVLWRRCHDVDSLNGMLSMLIRDLRERGTAVFLNTHLLAEAEQVCDRVTVISKGRALATGPPDELRRARPVVRFRVSGLAPGWWQPLANGARWKDEGGDWLLAEDLDPARIPDVVAGAVALGGRVEAVVPEQQSLEASFLELLGER